MPQYSWIPPASFELYDFEMKLKIRSKLNLYGLDVALQHLTPHIQALILHFLIDFRHPPLSDHAILSIQHDRAESNYRARYAKERAHAVLSRALERNGWTPGFLSALDTIYIRAYWENCKIQPRPMNYNPFLVTLSPTFFSPHPDEPFSLPRPSPPQIKGFPAQASGISIIEAC